MPSVVYYGDQDTSPDADAAGGLTRARQLVQGGTMAYDEALAARIREGIGAHPALSEQAMLGGLAFMIAGNMAVGVNRDELMVRVGRDAHEAAVRRPGARIMDFTSRPMVGWIVVSPDGYRHDADLDAPITQGVSFAESLSPK
jgi:hypothetical protein